MTDCRYKSVTPIVIKLSTSEPRSTSTRQRGKALIDRAAETSAFIARMLATGGDARIRIAAGAATNIYGASTCPRDMLAYSATTANDISLDAFNHLRSIVGSWPEGRALSADSYAEGLEGIRGRLRSTYGLPDSVAIVLAPSGTDLEYVSLHLAGGRSGKNITNILLGADEVGSGCGLAAGGRYFSGETVFAEQVQSGAIVAGLGETAIVDVAVRNAEGQSRSSRSVCADLDNAIDSAAAAGRHALVHIVHGSKTGLVLPDFSGIDALRSRHGETMSLVVDACQARISGDSIRAYLGRGAIVFVTGSKFMGGPPFSGIALVPPEFAASTFLPEGFASLFRRAEWPLEWAAADRLEHSSNPGLLLRLEAAMFELERFSALDLKRVNGVIAAFSTATRYLAQALGADLVTSSTYVGALESATMATLDLTPLTGTPDFAKAQRWQRVLAARGIRLGQPVKCVRLPDGRWGGTLRISLSMPVIAQLAALERRDCDAILLADMTRISEILTAAARPIAA